MSKSTRRAGGMRAGFEYFDRRQMGPWVLLRAVFQTWRRCLLLVIAVLVVTITADLNPYVMFGLLVVLFVGSFAVTWQLLGLLIRSRAVLFVAAVCVAGNWWFMSLFGDLSGNLLALALAVGLLVFPPTGRYLGRRVWCVVDRQRMRACLKVCKVRTMNLDGSLPLLLWARPTNIGERVWVWVRAGASGDDIEDALDYIAPACFAREARVHRVRKLTTLVAVDIIRRDPLGTGEAIPSPLASLSAWVKDTVTGEGTEPIRSVSVDEITSTATPAGPEPRNGSRKTTTPSGSPASAQPEGPRLVVSGEDLSDYVD